MDFTLSKEHQMLRTLFRDFAENEVKPSRRSWTRKNGSR